MSDADYTVAVVPDGSRIIVVPRGDVSPAEVSQFQDMLRERWPDVDIMIITGAEVHVLPPGDEGVEIVRVAATIDSVDRSGVE